MRLIIVVVSIALLLVLASCARFESQRCLFLSGTAKDNCYLEQHKCSKMENVAFRDSCVADLAKATKDISVCRLITTQQTKAYCQEQIAELKNDSTVCPMITDQYWMDNCHSNLAISNNEATLCASITNGKQKENCYQSIALETSNLELCPMLLPKQRETCYFTIAAHLNDTTICRNLNMSLSQNACILKIAKQIRNQKMCQQITIAPVREICNKDFGDNSS